MPRGRIETDEVALCLEDVIRKKLLTGVDPQARVTVRRLENYLLLDVWYTNDDDALEMQAFSIHIVEI